MRQIGARFDARFVALEDAFPTGPLEGRRSAAASASTRGARSSRRLARGRDRRPGRRESWTSRVRRPRGSPRRASSSRGTVARPGLTAKPWRAGDACSPWLAPLERRRRRRSARGRARARACVRGVAAACRPRASRRPSGRTATSRAARRRRRRRGRRGGARPLRAPLASRARAAAGRLFAPAAADGAPRARRPCRGTSS